MIRDEGLSLSSQREVGVLGVNADALAECLHADGCLVHGFFVPGSGARRARCLVLVASGVGNRVRCHRHRSLAGSRSGASSSLSAIIMRVTAPRQFGVHGCSRCRASFSRVVGTVAHCRRLALDGAITVRPDIRPDRSVPERGHGARPWLGWLVQYAPRLTSRNSGQAGA